MPTCDRPEFAPIAIESFLSQDFTDSELLIIDDGSSPIKHLLPELSPRIRYVQCEKKMNTGTKRNLGAELALGEIIVHFDDDDWSAPNRVTRQVERLEITGKQVTGCNAIFFYDSRDGNCYRYRGGSSYTLGTSQCYLKSWWVSHRFERSQTGEDTAFGRVAAKANQLDVISGEDLIVAVVHGRNTTAKPLNSTVYCPADKASLPAAFFASRA
jgi:glycosyltransferase involved in cell wall biosynthesis